MEHIKVNYQLVVCGGGLPGVCAAIAAARHGVKVALIEKRSVLGGNASSECRVPPDGAAAFGHNRMARESGIIEELRLEYAARTPHADNRSFFDLILSEWCRKENIDLYLNTDILYVDAKDSRINSVTAVQTSTERMICFNGDIFVDATGDGFVAYEAGAGFMKGRESKSEFNEPRALDIADSKNLGSTLYFILNRRDYPVKFTPPEWAKKYHSCSDLPHRPHNIKAIAQKNALSEDDSAYQLIWWLALGGERDVIKNSEQIYSELVVELMSVWDHLKNHCEPETRKALECYDLVWWSPFPLRRGSRRIIGDYIMTENDILSAKLFQDRVGYGGRAIDLHPPEGVRSPEPPCDQMFLHDLYSIPFRSLYSRDISNLMMAGRDISASYVAMGSLRVMSTLCTAAQAVGTAAYLCLEKGVLPRELGSKYIKELQQMLLKDDAYIIKTKNEDPEDIARKARIEATSSKALEAEDTDGFLELKYDIGQQVPVSESHINKIAVFLKSENTSPVSVNVTMYAGTKIGRLQEEKILDEKEIIVMPGTAQWYEVEFNKTVEPGTLLWICLSKNPGIFWGYTRKEAFGTRFAMKYDGPLEAAPAHGKARIAPIDDKWFPINNHGRLPAGLQSWLSETIGITANKPKATFNVRIDPVQKPYEASNINNGISRPEDWPNIWISDPKQPFPQSVELLWDKQEKISKVMLTFDTGLDYPERMFGWPRSNFRFPFPVPECVKDYDIEIWDKGQWKRIFSVCGNYQRRRIHVLEEALTTDKLRVVVKSTNGSTEARIYEIRVY